jgi:two-component system response regulator AtoC
MSRKCVLVADDDNLVLQQVDRFLTSRGYCVECADSGEPVIARLKDADKPSLLLLDLMMPRVSGLEILEEMERRRDRVPTVVLSGVDQVSMVVKAVRLGASDYLVKPIDEGHLERAVQNALDEPTPEATTPGATTSGEDACVDFVGGVGEIHSRSERMLRIKHVAAQVADTDVPVLILGESGVGKEVLARYIHSCSGRRAQPFVKVNCAALPVDLLESELFGYERGAFTGAMRDRPGKFELAGKGTILLDEIGEMSPHLQAKLLHVLQDGEYMRLGGSKPAYAEARVLAATNQRLEEAVSQGKFREDLYFRLNVVRLEIIPLRERPEDIQPLCGYFFEKYRIKYQRPARVLPVDTMAALERYSWPGNVRQLENVIKRLVILPDQDMALADLVETPASEPVPSVPAPAESSSLKKVSALAAERVEKELVLRTLQEVNWNRKQAARELSISYKALLNKLRRWKIGAKTAATSS